MGVMEIYLKMKKIRVLNQDDWKRTQVRMPLDQYDDVVKYAEQNSLSLNSAVLDLVSKGLEYDMKFDPSKFENGGDIEYEVLEHFKKIEKLLEEMEFFKSLSSQ